MTHATLWPVTEKSEQCQGGLRHLCTVADDPRCSADPMIIGTLGVVGGLNAHNKDLVRLFKEI